MLRTFADHLKQEFNGYNAASLTKDLMAGLTVAAFAQAIIDAKTHIHCCPVCQNLTEGDGPCPICSSAKRDSSTYA